MREPAQLLERPRAVREARAVAEVDEVLVRQGHQALVQHRQAADARVEHADRPLVHLRDCREGGRRLPSPVLRALVVAPSPRSRSPAPASAFSKRTGADDGRRRPARPRTDGAAPAAAGALVLHGLAGNRGTVDAVAARSRRRLFGARLRRPRARRLGGEITLAGPREVADLRALRAFAARAGERHDRRLGHLLRRRPDLERARGRSAARRGGGGRDVDVAVRRALAAEPRPLRDRRRLRRDDRGALAARGRHPRRRRPEHEPRSPARPLRRPLGRRPSGSIRTPVYLFQGKVDFAFDLSQATAAFARSPAEAHAGSTSAGRASTFPGWTARTCSRRASWFDRHLNGTRNGVDASKVVIAARTPLPASSSTRCRRREADLRPPRHRDRRGQRRRRRTPLQAALETWGSGTARVTVPKLARYPRLVVTVLAGNRVVAHGGLVPRRASTRPPRELLRLRPGGRGCASRSAPPPRPARSPSRLRRRRLRHVGPVT